MVRGLETSFEGPFVFEVERRTLLHLGSPQRCSHLYLRFLLGGSILRQFG